MKKFFENLFKETYYQEDNGDEEKFNVNLLLAFAIMNNFNMNTLNRL